MYYLVVGLYVLICFLLLVVVLLQQGKGGDIAAAFGGSSSQTAFGARAGATFLTRATAVLATLFMVGAFALGIIKPGGSSVVSGVKGPADTAPKAVDLPMTSPTPTGTPPATSPAATPGATDKGKAPATTPKADPKKTGRGGGL